MPPPPSRTTNDERWGLKPCTTMAITRSNVSATSDDSSNNEENGTTPDSGDAIWANMYVFFTSFVFFYILTNDFLWRQPLIPSTCDASSHHHMSKCVHNLQRRQQQCQTVDTPFGPIVCFFFFTFFVFSYILTNDFLRCQPLIFSTCDASSHHHTSKCVHNLQRRQQQCQTVDTPFGPIVFFFLHFLCFLIY